MTDSNLALMYKLDTLPQAGNLQTNYQMEVADMSKSVNESIDANQKRMDEHFDFLIQTYNHLHKRDENRPKEFIAALKEGKEFKSELEDFTEYWSKHNKYANKWKKQKADFSNIYGGEAWETFEGKGDFDPDVRAELVAKDDRAAIRVQATDLGYSIQDEDPYAANELILGPEASYADENEMIEDLDSLLVHHEASYRPRAEAGMKVRLPNQFTADGKPIYKTYQEANLPQEKRYISDMIDAWYAYKHQDLARGRLGFYKKDFINHMIELDETRVKQELETDAGALVEIQTENRAKELKMRIKRDPGYLIDYIGTYKGAHKGRYDLTRVEAFDTLISGVNAGVLTREDIAPVLDHKFLAHDSTPDNPHWVTARSYWKKDTRRLLKALSTQEKTIYEENEENRNGAMKAEATKIVAEISNQEEPLTFKSVNDVQLSFMEKFNIRDPELLPDIIKNLPYEGMHDDQELDAQLSYNHYTLNQRIEPSDLIGFTDPDLKKKWVGIAAGQTGLTKDGISRRNSAISAEVTARTMESDVNRAKTPKWVSNYEQATQEYDRVYNGVIENGGTPDNAHKEAMNAVKDGLWKQLPNGAYQWDTRGESTYNVEPAREAIAVVKAISSDRDMINSTTPWKGEEPHLLSALKYVQYSRQGREVNQPFYYRQIAKQIGMNPERLLLNRLESTGMLKPGDKLPEELNLSAYHQKLLLKPSAAKTYRVTQENDDIVWMLDTVASPIAEANGGYDAIRNQNGDYESIESITGKKLNEVTFADIVGLMDEGYTNIGRYDLTPEGLINVILANQLTSDTLFDQKGQDLVVLSRLRQKAQAANSYRTLKNRYRRLVNIPQEDQEQFLEMVGDLPTWLRLDTLLPEAAKELVRSTTLQE